MTAVVELWLKGLEHVFKVDPAQVVGEDAYEGVAFELLEDLRTELFECDVVLCFPAARVQFVLLKTIETQEKSHNLKRFLLFLSKGCRVKSSVITDHFSGEKLQAEPALHIGARQPTFGQHLHLRDFENLGAQLTQDSPHAHVAVECFFLLLLVVREHLASLAAYFHLLANFFICVATRRLLWGFRSFVSDGERLALLLVRALAKDG